MDLDLSSQCMKDKAEGEAGQRGAQGFSLLQV